jgi:hypothetical protein
MNRRLVGETLFKAAICEGDAYLKVQVRTALLHNSDHRRFTT